MKKFNQDLNFSTHEELLAKEIRENSKILDNLHRDLCAVLKNLKNCKKI